MAVQGRGAGCDGSDAVTVEANHRGRCHRRDHIRRKPRRLTDTNDLKSEMALLEIHTASVERLRLRVLQSRSSRSCLRFRLVHQGTFELAPKSAGGSCASRVVFSCESINVVGSCSRYCRRSEGRCRTTGSGRLPPEVASVHVLRHGYLTRGQPRQTRTRL